MCWRQFSVVGFNFQRGVIQYGGLGSIPLFSCKLCCIILSFMFWFLVVHGVCHLDFGGGNPHVKYLCAVASFYDEYYLVIGPFWIF